MACFNNNTETHQGAVELARSAIPLGAVPVETRTEVIHETVAVRETFVRGEKFLLCLKSDLHHVQRSHCKQLPYISKLIKVNLA